MSNIFPKIDTNIDMLTDYQVVNKNLMEVVTSADNLIIIGVGKNEGLILFSKHTEFFSERWSKFQEANKELVEESQSGTFMLLSLDEFSRKLDSQSYYFRFTESSFKNLPQELLTFNFDIVTKNGTVTSASITDENHPIVALTEALIDLGIQQSFVSAIAISVEYCGQVVFKSPDSLLKTIFRGTRQ